MSRSISGGKEDHHILSMTGGTLGASQQLEKAPVLQAELETFLSVVNIFLLIWEMGEQLQQQAVQYCRVTDNDGPHASPGNHRGSGGEE